MMAMLMMMVPTIRAQLATGTRSIGTSTCMYMGGPPGVTRPTRVPGPRVRCNSALTGFLRLEELAERTDLGGRRLLERGPLVLAQRRHHLRLHPLAAAAAPGVELALGHQ